MATLTTKPSGFSVTRGRSYTMELVMDGGTVSQVQVQKMLANMGFVQPSITVLDGDDPSAATHFLILAAYNPPPSLQWENTVALRDVSTGRTFLTWKKVAQL